MDVYYMSDSLHGYGSFRNPLYRDYEKFPYGSLENPIGSSPQKKRHNSAPSSSSSSGVAIQGKSKGKSTKESCPFCKEQKKRPLGAYMRTRGQRITSESISEDVEESCEEERAELGPDSDSPSGSPSNTALAASSVPSGHHQHHHHQYLHSHSYPGESRVLARQESRDSGFEGK